MKSTLLSEFMEEIRPYIYPNMRRLGKSHDGGYVVPDPVLMNVSSLIAIGYGNEFSFERDFINVGENNRVCLYDDKARLSDLMNEFFKSSFQRIVYRDKSWHPRKSLRNLMNYVFLLSQKSIHYYNRTLVSKKGKLASHQVAITDVIEGFNDYLLKVDIEGDEYQILPDLLQVHNLPTCMIIEFHDVATRAEEFISLLGNIKSKYFLVNSHVNNFGGCLGGIPQVLELAFLYKDSSNWNLKKKRNNIPHELDQPNSPRFEEVRYFFES